MGEGHGGEGGVGERSAEVWREGLEWMGESEVEVRRSEYGMCGFVESAGMGGYAQVKVCGQCRGRGVVFARVRERG